MYCAPLLILYCHIPLNYYKHKKLNWFNRFVMPALAIAGALFMIFAAVAGAILIVGQFFCQNGDNADKC